LGAIVGAIAFFSRFANTTCAILVTPLEFEATGREPKRARALLLASIPQHFGFHRKDTTVATKQGHNDDFAEANSFRFKFPIAKSTLKTDANAKSPKMASNRLKLVGFLYVTVTARSAKIFAVTKDAENWQGNANLNL
jgi:hypothetical protein